MKDDDMKSHASDKEGTMTKKAHESESKAEHEKMGGGEKKEKSKFKISKGKSFARGKR